MVEKGILSSLLLVVWVMVSDFSIAQDLPMNPQSQTPVWTSNGKIDEKRITGKLLRDGDSVTFDGANAFELPADTITDPDNFSIEFTVRRPALMSENPWHDCLSIVENTDKEKQAGFGFVYFPLRKDYEATDADGIALEINGKLVQGGGMGGALFAMSSAQTCKITLVMKDRQMQVFRNGLLLATTDEINSSSLPLQFGQIKKGASVPITISEIKIYNTAIIPDGFDPSVKTMKICSGPGYVLMRAEIEDPDLPRILVVGDSISMGYRKYITDHFKGKATVDYWVGGGWLDPADVSTEGSKIKQAWKGIFSHGPYDVVSWNSMTLHMWTPNLPQRCPEESLAPNMTEMVRFLQAEAPKTRFLWIRCTPIRKLQDDGTSTIDNPGNDRVVKYNAIVDNVMNEFGIPEVDLYGLCVENMKQVPLHCRDTLHWDRKSIQNNLSTKLSPEELGRIHVEEQMAAMINAEIEKNLP